MIAVTGATGFLGRHLTTALSAHKLSFRCLVRPDSGNLSKLSQITKRVQSVNYSDPTSIQNALRGCDTLIHTLGVINADQEALTEVNETIARRLMGAAKAEGVKKIIHISSVAAGMLHGPYGKSKRQGEIAVQEAGIPYTILRPAYIYGMGDENNTAMLIRTLKRWPVIPLLGGGTFKLQPVYVADVVELILKAIELPAQNTEFNTAGPAQITLKSMLIELSKNLGLKRAYLPVPLRPVQALMKLFLVFCPNTKLPAKQILELDKHEAFDISKTAAVFNFQPRPYHQGAKDMFESGICAA